MNKLKKYLEIDGKIKNLEEAKIELKCEIVQDFKKLDGKNKNKKLEIGKYIASITYAKSTVWNVEKAEDFFIKHNHRDCLKMIVDKEVVAKLESKKVFDKKLLDKLRKVAWDSPRLFVRNINKK